MLKEFREFAMRGNVVDLAVGLVLGVAFGAIVNSLVNDILMPPIGLALGGTDFSSLFITLKQGTTPGPYATPAAAKAVGAVTMNIGVFINTVINFLIVALALFTVVKAMNRIRRQAPPAAVEPTTTERLLMQIRDQLALRS